MCQRMIPGIWKLTTDSLPYELDIRSKLNKRFSHESRENVGNDGNCDEILLKLNNDGTFKQCDEGYREGRWVTGRWKVEMIDQEDKNTVKCQRKQNSMCVLLRLAMNRQYFGPPYDVLLEAKSILRDGATKSEEVQDSRVGQSKTDRREESFKQWRGIVKKGKFLRLSPGQHPFDAQVSPTLNQETSDDNENTSVDGTNVLVDAEHLGMFSLEQALTSSSISQISRPLQRDDDNEEGDKNCDDPLQTSSKSSEDGTNENGGGSDDTFFLPYSSSDDGVLQ